MSGAQPVAGVGAVGAAQPKKTPRAQRLKTQIHPLNRVMWMRSKCLESVVFMLVSVIMTMQLGLV